MRYAAYGSNLHPSRLRQRAASAVLLGTQYVAGFDLHFHKRGMDRSAKCNILGPGNGVFVAVYEIDAHDKQALDAIEGVGNGYTDGALHVPGFGECFTYQAEDTHIDDELAPYDWYKAMVVLGCAALSVPADYMARIQAVEAIPDPHVERRDENWEIVEVMRRETRRPLACRLRRESSP